MQEESLRVLLVEDDDSLRDPLAKYLHDYGYQVDAIASDRSARKLVLEADSPYAVALIDDLLLPEPEAAPKPIGIDLMKWIKETCPDTECIIFTGQRMKRALTALRAGAYRYLSKPLDLDELDITIRMAVEQMQLKKTGRTSDQMSALNQVVLEIGQELDRNVLLQKVVDLATDLLAAEGGGIYLLDSANEHLVLETATGLSLDFEGQVIGRDEGLSGEILLTGEPQKIMNYYRWQKRLRFLDDYKLTAVAGAPIRIGERVLGTLVVHDTRPERQFDDLALMLLQQFANHTGLALQKTQLLETLQAIQQVSTTITSSSEFQEVLNHTCQAAFELFDVDHSGLVLFDPDLTWGRVAGEYPPDVGALGKRIPIQGVLVEEKLAREREPFVCPDVEKAKQELGPVLEILHRLRIQSICIVPIVYRNRVLGSFSLDMIDRSRQFTREEIELSRVFADHIAVAVENARLFSKLTSEEELSRALIENAFDVVIYVDQNKRIKVFNRRAEETFGWAAAEMYDQTVARLHRDVGRAQEIFKMVRQRGTISGWKVDLKHRDGSPIPALLSATQIQDAQGKLIGQAGFLRDLRQVKLLEERLQALIQVSQTITGTLDLEEVLKRVILNAVAAFPKAKQGTIHLYDEQSDLLRLQANTLDYSSSAVEALSFEPGVGITGWVFQKRLPVILDDAHQDSRYVPIDHPEVPLHRSMICLPLEVQGQIIGTLSIDNPNITGAFQSEDMGLLRTFADQAAIALQNARLFKEAQIGLEQLRSLYQAGSNILSALDPEQILKIVVEEACQALGGWRAKVVLIAEKGEPIGLVEVGFEEGRDAVELVRPDGISAQVTSSGEPWYRYDVQKDSRSVNPVMLEDGVRAAACVPFSLRDRNIGVMWIHYKDPRRFLPAEIEALRLYASQAAIAYDNARHMQELEHLRRAAETLASVASVQDVLQQIVKSARQVLAADSAVIWSYDAVRRTFLPDELVADGITPELMEKFRRDEPRPGGTAEIVIERTYLAVSDIDQPEYRFLGKTARGLRGGIGARAFQGIALREVDEVLGVLYVNYARPRYFSAEDRTTLETFANHAALTLKKARLLEQVSRAHDMAQVVARVSVLGDLSSTLDSIAKGTQEALSCDAVTLCTYDQTRGQFGSPVLIGVEHPQDIEEQGWLARESVLHSILQFDELHVAEDAPTDPVVGGPFVKRENIKSSVGIPLQVGDRKVGVMFVNYRSPHRFTSGERLNIELFAHQAAVAIRNAQLYDETTRRANAQQALYEAGKRVTSTLALDETLNHIVEQAWAFTEHYGSPARFSDLELLEGTKLSRKAAYPPEHLEELQKTVGTIDIAHAARIGITGRVAKSGQSLLVGDVNPNPDYIKYDPETRSELAVPIKLGSEVIGVINVEHSNEGAFDEQDQQTLEALAAQAALAIRNAQLYQQLQRRISTLQALYQAGRTITSTASLQETLDRIVEQAMELLEGRRREGCFSHLALVEGHILHFAAAYTPQILKELREEIRDLNLEWGERIGITGRAVKTGVSQNVGDVSKDPDYIGFETRTRSELAVPLKINRQVIGVINMEHPEREAFDQSDRRALESLAAQAAIAIRNARQSELWQAIYEASKVISAGVVIERKELLHRILEQAATRIRWSKRSKSALRVIQLYDKETNTIRLESVHPPEEFPRLLARIGERRSLDRASGAQVGISGRAVLEGKVQRVSDVRLDPDYVEFDPETLSELDVPLQAGDETLGVLSLESDRLAAFDEDDERALQSLAELAVIAIQNARLYANQAATAREKARRTQQLEHLRRASKVIAKVSALEDLTQTLNSVAEGTLEALGCDAVTLYTYDQRKDEFGLPPSAAGLRDGRSTKQQKTISEESVLRRILDFGQTYVAEDTLSDPKTRGDFVKREGIKSSAGIPLQVRKRKVGAMFVNYRSHHTFTDDELSNIELFANQTAVAIRNAQLYNETIEKANALQALYEAGKAVSQSLALDEILTHIVEQAWRITGYFGKRARFSHLALRHGNTLQLEAAYPLEYLSRLKEPVKAIDLEQDEAIGIQGRAVKTGVSQLVGDVTQDPDYIQFDSETRSELAVPIELEDKVIGVINVEHPGVNAFDEQDRQTLEALAVQAAIAIQNARMYSEIKELDKRKTEFLSTVSHELRSPLTPVKSCLENMLSGLYGPTNDKQRNRLEIALTNANEESRLIENLLDLVRIQEDRVSLDFESAEIADLVQEVVDVFEYDASRKKIELETDLPTEEGLRTVLDRGKIKQVLTNLISNAVKFTPENGSVIVSATADGAWITVQVQDTGIGIPTEEQEKIFDRFYQVDSSLTRKIGGTGIGLSIVKEYVEMHGGRVWIESELGTGSTFTFTLPKREEGEDND